MEQQNDELMLPLNESYLSLKNDMNPKLFNEREKIFNDSRKKLFGHKEIKFYDNIKVHNGFKNGYQNLFVNIWNSQRKKIYFESY